MVEDRGNAIAHLETIKNDIRDEIKRRIEQRDKYAAQLLVALGAILVLAISPLPIDLDKDGSAPIPGRSGIAILGAPLVSLYYIALVLYSYRIHRICAKYLREEIEPELAELCGVSPGKEWETYYSQKAREVPGIREKFFIVVLMIVCFFPVLYLWLNQIEHGLFWISLVIATALYVAIAVGITYFYVRKRN